MPINKSTYFINTKKNFIASHGIIACCLCTSFSMLASFSPKTTTLHSIRNFEITNFKQNEKKKEGRKDVPQVGKQKGQFGVSDSLPRKDIPMKSLSYFCIGWGRGISE